MFGQGWDDVVTKNLADPADVQAEVGRQSDLHRLEHRRFLPRVRGALRKRDPDASRRASATSWDLAPASLAEVSARVKRSLEKLRSAEALATLVALQNPSFLDGRDVARDRAMLDLGLFFEHDFENGGPRVDGAVRIAWQRQVAAEIETYADTLMADASSALGAMIQKSGTNQRFFAFNPLSWSRTDVADVPYSGSAARSRRRPHDRLGGSLPGGDDRRPAVSPRRGSEHPVGRLQGLRDPGGSRPDVPGRPDRERDDGRDGERVPIA